MSVYNSEQIRGQSKRFKLLFVKQHPDAILPEKNHNNDSGYDIFACEDCTIPGCSTNDGNVEVGYAVVTTGIKVANIPSHLWFRIEARSGLGFKHGLMPHFGIIDNGYRGNLGVKIYNLKSSPYEVKRGDRIAQLVLYPLVQIPGVGWSEQSLESERGEKGFGSSGK